MIGCSGDLARTEFALVGFDAWKRPGHGSTVVQGAPSLCCPLVLLSSHTAKASTRDEARPGRHQLSFWGHRQRNVTSSSQPCLSHRHLPRDDVGRVVDPGFQVVSDDEMLHPGGQDLGEEGEEVRAGEWVPGLGDNRMWDPPLALCSLCWLPWGDRKTGEQVGRSFLLAWICVSPDNHPLLPKVLCLFIISIVPLTSPSPPPGEKQEMEPEGIPTAEPGMGSCLVSHQQRFLGSRS